MKEDAILTTDSPFELDQPQPQSERLSQSGRNLIVPAWGTTILISTVPDIIFNELTGTLPAWLVEAKMALLIILTLTALLWKPLRPLRYFFIVMFAFFGLFELRLQFDFTLPFLQKIFGTTVFDARMQAEQTGKLAVTLAMIAFLLILGFKRQHFFLTPGNLRAPIKPVKLMGFPKAAPWLSFGLQWGFYIAAALAIIQYISLRPSGDVMLKVLPILPSIFFYAALNAFNEEFTYRAPMLATLEPVTNSNQAVWLSASFFGIAHYFGTPGGILGGLLSVFMGWILGKGMIETRGFFWTWWIHFLSDIAIFTFLTAALLQ